MRSLPRAAIYCRISQDRAGAGLGVERQEADCRKLCDRMGWEVVEVFVDNDLSAFSGRHRPEWNRLQAEIRSGRIEAVAAWHIDRLTRQVRELEDVIDLAERYGVKLATVAGEVDLTTSTGRMQARMMGIVARQSSEQASERLRRQRLQAAEAGQYHGGPRRYGYESDGRTIREDEAVVVREAAERILAGESLHSLVNDFTERGLTSTRGNPWSRKALRGLLINAAISGRREHKGVVTAVNAWPGIITVEQSDRLRSILTAPGRGVTAGRKYMLSGVLRCHRCQRGLVGRTVHGKPRYVCDRRPDGGCGSVAVTIEFADRVVRDMVLTALESDDFRDRLHQQAEVDPAVHEAIAKDERKLEELAEEWAHPDSTLTRGEWRKAREIIETRLTANRAKVNRANGTTALDGLEGSYDDMLSIWQSRNTSQRRAIVMATLLSVTVGPSARKFDQDRFQPTWRV